MINYPTKKLGDIAKVGAGNSAPQDKKYFTDGTVPFFRTADVGRVHFSTDLSDTGDFLNEKAVDEMGLKIWPKNTILFPKSGASTFLNHRVMIGTDGVVSSHLATIFTENNILQKYIFYFLTTIDTKTLTADQGYPSLRISDLQKIQIPLPPLATQKQIVERLDKIAEAQKLNDDLIQKSDELYRSLLHNELNAKLKNQNAKSQFKIQKLKEVLSSEKYKVGKLKREAYQKSGNFPIIDQSVNDIAGYSDEKDLVYSGALPAVIYGDHTRIVKFTDKPFILGADGTKILIPNDEVLAEYLYFALQLFNVGGQGYKRHFPILKEVKIPTPPLKTQKQIVAKLSAAQEYKTQLLDQKSKLKELFDSVLARSMNSEQANPEKKSKIS